MVVGIRVGREESDVFQINEMDLSWDDIDRVFDVEIGPVKGDDWKQEGWWNEEECWEGGR